MPRQSRTSSATGIYHVMMRGVNRQNIFDDDDDYRLFLGILGDLPFQYDDDGRILPQHTCCIYAWCLMTNHFHLLIREQDWTISEIVKSLASSYVFYYNKKNGRIGPLFQERFKSEPCNDMAYFVTLLRYIHQNPVKAGIVTNAADYPWSSWSQDYLNHDGIGITISSVNPVLKRIPLNELRELINEPCTADCIEFDNCRRLTDIEVREIIQNLCGAKTVSDFQHQTKEIQEQTIIEANETGASYRQLVRQTGYTLKRVQTLCSAVGYK